MKTSVKTHTTDEFTHAGGYCDEYAEYEDARCAGVGCITAAKVLMVQVRFGGQARAATGRSVHQSIMNEEARGREGDWGCRSRVLPYPPCIACINQVCLGPVCK